MAKHLLEDMVRVKRSKKITPQPEIPKTEPPKIERTAEIQVKYSKNKSRYMLWFIALISVTFCFFAFSFLFARAEVSVDLKKQDVVLNENLSANIDSNTDILPFELTHLSGDVSKTIILEERDVRENATGRVIIYNKFNSSPQILPPDTRLEGSNNKIYKTKTKVIVPGMSKNGAPGQVNVGIYALEQGSDYNSAPLDFKIAAFKKTIKYSKFYGRSVGDISGGIVGKSRQVSDLQKTEATNELTPLLKEKLFNKIATQIPGFLLYKDATFLNTEDITAGPVSADGSASLTLKGTLYGIIFDEKKLTERIAKDNIEKYDNSEVYIPDIKDLNFSLSDRANILFDSVKNINFVLSGSAKIIWKLDINKFTADLLGKPKKDFNQLLSQYKSINSALVKLSPPWIQSLPGKAKDIKITIN